MLYTIALIITVIGWAFQFYQTVVKKDRSINPVLPIAYAIACILFGYNSFIAGGMTNAILDAVCALFALVVFGILITRKK
jgi:Ca2+/Na+ antiporter